MKLISDFTDYYDFHFDVEGEIFCRKSRNNISRGQALSYLFSLGFDTPVFNKVCELSKYICKETFVVVYVDEYAHRGESKELIELGKAVEKYYDKIATLYIPKNSDVVHSKRILCIGKHKFILSYTSADDEWRSNCGVVYITILEHEIDKSMYMRVKKPLFAIDLVQDIVYGNYYAIDFNTSPGLHDTGINKILKPQEVVDCIKEAKKHLGSEEVFKDSSPYMGHFNWR